MATQLLNDGFCGTKFVYFGSWEISRCIIYGLVDNSEYADTGAQDPDRRRKYIFLKVQLPTARRAYDALVGKAPEAMHPPRAFQSELVRKHTPRCEEWTRLDGGTIEEFLRSQPHKVRVGGTSRERADVYTLIWAPNGQPVDDFSMIHRQLNRLMPQT
jgi:hypothetical protein